MTSTALPRRGLLAAGLALALAPGVSRAAPGRMVGFLSDFDEIDDAAAICRALADAGISLDVVEPLVVDGAAAAAATGTGFLPDEAPFSLTRPKTPA